ncbi:hypothetical protein [Arachnia propionica]|uniref:Uncharacterized protein n=1 Tax=Arachnia propionica TaxID=1750 RepID=A0A3P1WS12_9ACTN|nr:hypothetical protein [Arachnia propionica]RRD48756.1 hypothetical protein EII35_11150 [Arachnia propionica]
MSILNWLRRTPKKSEPETRIMPKPVKVDLDDYRTHTSYFSRLSRWDIYRPLPMSEEIPDLEPQLRKIEERVTRHAADSTLDGLVPDLLDREIHENCAEVRARIDAAHEQAREMLKQFLEQAMAAEAELQQHITRLRHRRARSEREFCRAWQELTGEEPALPQPEGPGAEGVATTRDESLDDHDRLHRPAIIELDH